MDRVLALGSLFAVGLGRLFLAYNFLNIISTPLLLSIIVSATSAVFGLAQFWMLETPTTAEHTSIISMQHVAYTALDIIFLNFAVKDPSLITFVLIQLLAVFFSNLMSKSAPIKFTLRNVIAAIVVSVGCYLLYISQWTFGGLPFFAAVIWSLVSVDLNALNIQRRNPNAEKSHLQSEIIGSTFALVLSLLVWVNNSERLYLVKLRTDLLPSLSVKALATGALLFGQKRLASQIPKHSIHETTSTLLVLGALIVIASIDQTLVTPHSIAAAVMFVTGAYLTSPPVNESHHNTIQPSPRDEISQLKTIVVIGFGFLLLVGYSSSTINQAVSEMSQTPITNETNSNSHQISQYIESPLVDEYKYVYTDIQYDISPAEIARQNQRYQCLHKTRQYIINQVTSLIVQYANFTAMDYEYNFNLADATVWFGQEKVWHIYGQFPARFDSSWEMKNMTLLQPYRDKWMQNGTIFLTGGGTMNEASSSRVALKTAVAKTFKQNPIVLMPDIITLKEDSYLLTEQKAAFSEHSKVTILLQDQGSIDFAAEHYPKAKVMYVPDVTWMIGPILPNTQPVIDVMLLFRRDSEGTMSNSDITSLIQTVNAKGFSAEAWDFPFKGYPVYKDSEDFVWYNYTKIYPNKVIMRPKAEENMDMAPEFKTQIAVSLLSRARIIVTDRLHATIMANLVDKPVVYFNEKSGKNELVRKKLTGVIEECSESALNIFFEKTAAGAVSKAVKYLRAK